MRSSLWQKLPGFLTLTFVFGLILSGGLFETAMADELSAMPAANSITLTWTAPGDDGSSGIAAQYDIRYLTEPIDETNWDAAIQVEDEPAPQAAGSTETFAVTGLLPNTTYYFAIKTADEVPNWSGLSNVASATTLDSVSPASIADLTAEP
jgi:hypothetical protein